MATIPIRPFRPYKTFSGGHPFRMALPEVASQTFKAGAVVVLNGAGKVMEAGVNPAGIMGVSEGDGLNIAAPTDADKTKFAVADPNTIFVGNVSTGQTTAQTDVTSAYGITKVGENWTIDKTKTGASARVRIVDLDPRDAVGDIQGRLMFQFYDTYTAFATTS